MAVIFKVVYILPEDREVCAGNGGKTRGDRSLWSRLGNGVIKSEASAEPRPQGAILRAEKMPGVV
jgi:hypothetical protein